MLDLCDEREGQHRYLGTCRIIARGRHPSVCTVVDTHSTAEVMRERLAQYKVPGGPSP